MHRRDGRLRVESVREIELRRAAYEAPDAAGIERLLVRLDAAVAQRPGDRLLAVQVAEGHVAEAVEQGGRHVTDAADGNLATLNNILASLT